LRGVFGPSDETTGKMLQSKWKETVTDWEIEEVKWTQQPLGH
jgi:hypothetical protein